MVLSPDTSEALVKLVREQEKWEMLRQHNLMPRRKLLLTGPPGCGKTMTAQAIAGELGIPVFIVRLDGLMSKFMGESIAKLRLIFDAMPDHRGVYLFDEFDSIGSHRNQGQDVGEIKRVLNSFLINIEKDQSNSIIIAATNLPESLDKALFRRFDDIIQYPLPGKKEIQDTLKKNLQSFTFKEKISFPSIASEAIGLNYSDIVRACEETIKEMILSGSEYLDKNDLIAALRKRKANSNLPHIIVNGFVNSEVYKYPKDGGPKFPVQKRNRATHGTRILNQLEAIRTQFDLQKDVELPESIVRDDAIYVEFESAWSFKLNFEQLNDNKLPPKYQLLNVKKEKHTTEEKYRYRVLLMLTEGGISHFVKGVEDYLTKNTKYKGIITDTPEANSLIANIETIQLATLKAFWSDEPEIPFPEENEVVWWEVWFRKSNENEQNVIQNLTQVGATIGISRLVFAEHIVRLVRASAKQLSNSLIFLDNLAELRKPQEMNDFISHDDVQHSQKELWLENLLERTEDRFGENGVLICLLDSGVNNLHPLLSPLLPNERLLLFPFAS